MTSTKSVDCQDVLIGLAYIIMFCLEALSAILLISFGQDANSWATAAVAIFIPLTGVAASRIIAPSTCRCLSMTLLVACHIAAGLSGGVSLYGAGYVESGNPVDWEAYVIYIATGVYLAVAIIHSALTWKRREVPAADKQDAPV